MKPVIGIVTGQMGGEVPRFAVPCAYVRAVERAGGLALQLPVSAATDGEVLQQWLSLCGGFLLAGGGDVAPAYYCQSPIPQIGPTSRLRDNVELSLCRAAQRAGKPVLGICRGIQVLNVAFGGTLWQDIPVQCRGAICHAQSPENRGELFHSIGIAPGSVLAGVMGSTRQECNSFHHQAVRDVASGFLAVAHAPDGVIEAVEDTRGLMLGVQWHAEELEAQFPSHAAMFQWLVEKAKSEAM